jgi:hypothetical protein
MRKWIVPALTSLLMLPLAAEAETSVEAGSWEIGEKTAIEGQPEMAAPSRTVCLGRGEATLERLVMPPPEQMAARKCTAGLEASGGTAKATMTCPMSDDGPAITGNLDIKYSATGYEATGPIEFKMKDGSGGKGKTTLAGKRVGDC